MRAFDPADIDHKAFLRDVRALRSEIDASLGAEDIAHLRKMERWGRACTLLGMATAGVCPNPVSAVALAMGDQKVTEPLLVGRGIGRIDAAQGEGGP